MKPKIIDQMGLTAPDQRTLAAEIRAYLKLGWRLQGETKQMRPLHNLAALVHVQWVVLHDDHPPQLGIEHVPLLTQAPAQRR